jgi:NAD(P)-dependent dehydrogenase (short-subunit alcohol dehydrogenase family)
VVIAISYQTATGRAEIAAFLCSPAARSINGAAIVADGGQVIGNWTDVWDMDQA